MQQSSLFSLWVGKPEAYRSQVQSRGYLSKWQVPLICQDEGEGLACHEGEQR